MAGAAGHERRRSGGSRRGAVAGEAAVRLTGTPAAAPGLFRRTRPFALVLVPAVVLASQRSSSLAENVTGLFLTGWAVLLAFPFATPEAVALPGVRRCIGLVRVVAGAAALDGLGFLTARLR